jgi:hypothetical protein
LTAEWGENILDAVAEITERHKLLTGSTCGIPDDASWIERSWFGPKVRIPQSHLNSGHLVVGRAFFEEIGGFDGSLRTGEDYDISVRALRAGAEIHENGRLSVVHHGYPRTLRAFVRREMWHGHSDYDSLRSILASRVALASILFALLHIAFVIGVLLSLKWVVLASTVGVVGLCYAASYQRYPREAWSIIVANAGIYYFYLAARFLAFVRRLLPMQRFTHREER